MGQEELEHLNVGRGLQRGGGSGVLAGAGLAWLKAENIPFYIRIKKDAKVPNSRGQQVQARQLFQFLKPGEALTLPDAKTMTGITVYLRLADGELLIVASDQACPDAIAIYGKRWQIETLFACLKGRGFNLEETRVNDRTRIKRFDGAGDGFLLSGPHRRMAT